MPILSEPRCPICGATVSLLPLWRAAAKDEDGLLEKKTGITCPFCSQKLRVLQGRGNAALMAVMGLMLVVIIAAERPYNLFPPNVSFGLILLLIFVMAFVVRRIAPFLATLRVAKEGEDLDYPLDAKIAGRPRR
jgi:DNA-directed RNA polymerase subunit RPC12/RpoP